MRGLRIRTGWFQCLFLLAELSKLSKTARCCFWVHQGNWEKQGWKTDLPRSSQKEHSGLMFTWSGCAVCKEVLHIKQGLGSSSHPYPVFCLFGHFLNYFFCFVLITNPLKDTHTQNVLYKGAVRYSNACIYWEILKAGKSILSITYSCRRHPSRYFQISSV